MAEAAKNFEIDSVSTAARLALSQANGDVAKGAQILAQKVRKDAALKRALLEPLLEYACHQAVGRELRSGRSMIWNAPASRLSSMAPADRVAALAADNLLMFPLPGGKVLGEATRAEIIEAADFYGKQASDMAHKARWMQLVAQSLPDGKTTKQVMTCARLRELQEEARNVA